MKKIVFGAFLSALLLLCGCGFSENTADPTGAGSSTSAFVEEPTPTPITELTFPDGSVHMADETSLDLSGLAHADVAKTAELLKQMPNLETLELGSDGAWTGTPPELTAATACVERPEAATRDLSWADLRALQEAAPSAELIYRFCFYGREFTTLDEEMDLNHSTMTDEGAAVKEILPLMKHCKYLDMDSCGVSSESMAEIRDAYPEMEVVWRIWFGKNNYTLRTDAERILHSEFKAYMTDDETQDLKYCTKVRFLDMGHNRDLHDWSFLSGMTDLEVCIITDSGWTTLDMLAPCTKLEYLEVCPISHEYCGLLDLSPLGNLVNLEHLNICGISETTGWEALMNLTKLKRLWIGHWTAYGLPEGAVEQLRAALPDTEINTTEKAAAVGSWKGDWGTDGVIPERYLLVRE